MTTSLKRMLATKARAMASDIVRLYSSLWPKPNPGEFMFLIRLLAMCDNTLRVRIPATELAESMRLTSRQLRTYARDLETAGLLARESIRGVATEYDLLPFVEKLTANTSLDADGGRNGIASSRCRMNLGPCSKSDCPYHLALSFSKTAEASAVERSGHYWGDLKDICALDTVVEAALRGTKNLADPPDYDKKTAVQTLRTALRTVSEEFEKLRAPREEPRPGSENGDDEEKGL